MKSSSDLLVQPYLSNKKTYLGKRFRAQREGDNSKEAKTFYSQGQPAPPIVKWLFKPMSLERSGLRTQVEQRRMSKGKCLTTNL